MIQLVLLILAIICFALATFTVSVGFPLLPLGLGLFAGAHLPFPARP